MTRARALDLGLFGLLLGGLVLAFAMRLVGSALSLGGPLPTTCWLRAVTGIECPFCGMTRSVVLTVHGDLVGAWHMHPAGPLFVLGALAGLVAIVGAAVSRQPALCTRPIFVQTLQVLGVVGILAGIGRTLL